MTESAAMQLFDGNVLLGPLPPGANGAPERLDELLQVMGAYRIERALVTHALAKWYDATIGNERLMRETSTSPNLTASWVVLPCSSYDPMDEEAQIARLLESGARAARLCPVAHRLAGEPWELDRLLGAAAEREVPLFLDFDNVHWSEERPWRLVEWACRTFPRLPVILVREPQSNFRTLFRLLDMYENLLVEISYFQGHSAIEIVTEHWGAQRMLFGTGMPVWDPALPIAGLMYSQVDARAMRMISYDNLQGLINGCRV